MLRGVQKQIIQVQIQKNRYFEAAYFVLRPDLRPSQSSPTEMTKEANRILCEGDVLRRKGRRGGGTRATRVFSFCCGALLGAVAVALIWLGVLLFSGAS